MLGVRLSEDLDRRLSVLALKTKRPKSFFVKEALIEYLDEYESIYESVAQYEEQKKKGALKLYTLEDVIQENGISDEELAAADDDKL